MTPNQPAEYLTALRRADEELTDEELVAAAAFVFLSPRQILSVLFQSIRYRMHL